MSVNEEIYERQFRHESYVYRLSVAAGNDIISALSDSDKETLKLFNSSIENIKTSSGKAQIKAIDNLASDIIGVRHEFYDPALEAFYEALPEYAEYEAEFQKRIVEDSVKEEVGALGVLIDIATASGVGAIIGSAIDGFVKKSNGQAYIIRESMDGLLERELIRLRETIAAGVSDDLDNKDIRDSIFGPKRSVFNTTNTGIKGNTRSAYTSIADKAIQALAKANGGLIGGWINSSIIDARTSDICKTIASQFANVIALRKEEIPAAPRHIFCRSRVVFILQHWSKLGLDIRDGKLYITGDVMSNKDKAALASSFGLSSDQYGQLRSAFPKERPESNIERVLSNANDAFLDDFFQSKVAADAFKSGRLTVDELYDSEDKTPLTIAEIKKKES